jgi:hypothetical protein
LHAATIGRQFVQTAIGAVVAVLSTSASSLNVEWFLLAEVGDQLGIKAGPSEQLLTAGDYQGDARM